MDNRNMKLNIRVGIVILAIVIIVSFFQTGKYINTGDKYSAPAKIDHSKPYIEMKKFDEEIFLINDVMKHWLEGNVDGSKLYDVYARRGRIFSAKSPIIQYAIYDIPQNVFIKKQEFKLSLNKDYKDAEVYVLGKDDRNLRLDYLNVGKKYYYKLTVYFSDKNKIEYEGAFKTADTPRVLNVSGVWNLRDVGGYYTKDGKRIRQGLLYRGTELDGAVHYRYKITDNGKKIMLNDLKIKSELDLRLKTTKNAKDMLGESVNHKYYDFSAYYESFLNYGQVALKKLFSDIAKPEIYPAYMHCTYGKDRTGTACYLLMLLLGVDEEQAYREWELSVLFDGEVDYQSMNFFVENIKSVTGETMQEKATNFLLEAGVKQQEIDSIKEIFLEKVK